MIIFCCLIPILLFGLPIIKGRPILQSDYYDHFGDETGFSYYGGHILVTCKIGARRIRCDFDSVYLIDPDNKVVGKAPCYDQVTFRLDINETTKFGKYRCKHKNETSLESLGFNYRFCSDSEQACTSNNGTCLGRHGAPNKFCVVSANGTYPCTALEEGEFDRNWCINETDISYCPAGVQSLCDVFQSDLWNSELNARGYAQITGDTCFDKDRPDYSDPYIGREEKKFNEPLRIGIETYYIHINCPLCDEACMQNIKFTCVLKYRNGSILEESSFNKVCNEFTRHHVYYFNLSTYEKGFNNFKLQCIFRNDSGVVARLSKFVYLFGSLVNVIHDKSSNSLYCKLNTPLLPELNISYLWYKDESLRENEMGPRFQLTEDGYYICGYNLTYKTCSPFREFRYFGWSMSERVFLTDGQPHTESKYTMTFAIVLLLIRFQSRLAG